MPLILSSAERSLRQLRTQIGIMRTFATLPDEQLYATRPLSRWTPSEHLDHLTRVSVAMLRGSVRNDLPPLPAISLLGRLVLTVGWIPRGVGKAPEKYRGTRVPAEALVAAIDKLEGVAATADATELSGRPIPTIPHPRFGGLTPVQALRFVAVHNDHHLRIIRDILAA